MRQTSSKICYHSAAGSMRTWMASMSSLPLPGSGFFPASTMLNPNLHDDLIPSIGDTPEIESIAVPSYEPRGPYGAKEVGEGSMVPVLGSIANAICDAIGVRMTSRRFFLFSSSVLAAIIRQLCTCTTHERIGAMRVGGILNRGASCPDPIHPGV